MTATLVISWLRLELRRRWRSLVVLVLLVAVASAVVITSLAASRRGASALSRLQSRTAPTTIGVLPNTPGFDWGPIERLPEVAALTKFVVDYAISVDGVSGNGLGFPFADDNFGKTLERPVVFAGRMFDPARPDEAVVTRKFVRTYGKGVGATVVVHLPTPKQLDDTFTGGNDPSSLDGPAVTVRIVGVVASPWLSDGPDMPGALQLSPGLTAKYPRSIIGDPSADNTQFINALVRLKHGGDDIPAFTDDLRRVTGRSDIGFLNLVQQSRDIQHQISFESRCLVAFAVAAFVAALFLVGQAITRYAAASTTELQTLNALGMTPMQSALTASCAPALVGVVGAVLGAAVAWAASSHFPFGTAAFFEPSPGRQWDWVVTTPIAAVVIVLVAVGAALAARLAVGAARREASRRSTLATAVARTGAGVPTVLGSRFALESGRGRNAIPVRPALIGAVTGVLGVVAAFTFSSGVNDAATHPERFGQTFQLGAFVGINNQDFGPGDKVAQTLAAQPEVAGIDDARSAVATAPNGRDTVDLWVYQHGDKPIDVVVLHGRLPVTADEVLLAPKTLAALHTKVGAAVTLTGSRGTPQRLQVVGSGFVPLGPHNGYADGGWITPAGYDTLFKDFKFHVILLALKEPARAAQLAPVLAGRLNKAVPELHGQANLQQGDVPTEVAEIREVRTLPIVLGGFLVLLALAAVGHALATAVRRRSHDLAVMRAVGMTPWQCRRVVITQASVLALVGLVFGVPLGLALGRTVWRVVADYTPIQYVPPLAVIVLALIAPASLVLANLLAAWPGRRAARLRIAHVLRAE